MLLSIVLVKYKYLNFAQGSRILIRVSLKYHTSTLETKVIVLHTSCVCILETDPWLVKST